jgi:hypothetical protein
MSAPNVEAVRRRSYTSPSLKLIYEPTGEALTITQISKLPGVQVSGRRLMDRWHAEGRPRVVTAEMVRPHGPARSTVVLDYPPHGRVTFRQIQRIHRALGKSLQFFRDRWRRAGRPAVVTAALFDHPDMRRIKDRTVPVPTDPKYLDDSLWSPDVPYADLCHLSNTENTGAGKGAIPDEEWIAMRSSVRCVLAGLYRRIPAAGTGGD